jgi:thiamine biosynthesis lipoprotein
VTVRRTAAAVLSAVVAASCTPVHEYRRVVMGAECRILVCADEATADRAAAAAFRRLAEVEEALSDWMASSEVRRLPTRAGECVTVSPDLADAIAVSLDWSARTDGAFDATLGALTGAWRSARRAGAPLDRREARDLLDRCGWRNVRFDRAARTYAPAVDGLRLDFGAIGQGIGADAAMAALRAEGVDRALVDLSGDIVAGEPPDGRWSWRVTSDDDAGRVLFLRHQAVTTSGDREQHLDAAGVRLSHVLDPATGWPITTRVQVTAGAPTATEADALATALCVLGPDRGQVLLARLGPTYWARWSWPDGVPTTAAPAVPAPASPPVPPGPAPASGPAAPGPLDR